MEDRRYAQVGILLTPCGAVYLYTDGVTEAVNRENAFFTETRLLEAVNRHGRLDPEALLRAVKRELDEFTGSAEQADDVTMLALRYNGGEETAKYREGRPCTR
jgi:sigma-B regulation protein RsbU (phosphoserine phosphatase)